MCWPGCKAQVPRYVRLNRVMRDFPTTNIVAGNKKANLRQLAQERLREAGSPMPLHPLPRDSPRGHRVR
jgi:histone acetyltransferase (RNA polymerase elongator complex component)